jgi:hypothetical protein
MATESGKRGGARSLEGPWFLEKRGTPEFNQQLKHTQSADSMRTVGFSAPSTSAIARATCWISPATWSRRTTGRSSRKAVQLRAIHLEKGMHCIDCHFAQDNHGNGNL